jgi:long-chain acyl-CoA synthetase
MNAVRRPWLELYESVPSSIKPAAHTGLEMFHNTLARRADGPLVHYFDQSITAGQLDAWSDALAVALQARGAEPGERIAMYLQNIPQVFIAVLAAWKCGAVIVPCNPMLRERELTKILSDSGSRILIAQEDLHADVARAALPATAVQHIITTSPFDRLDRTAATPRVLSGLRRLRDDNAADLFELTRDHAGKVPQRVEITGDDVAFMVYTSGTTGEPKAAMNTHRNVVFATSVYERWIGLTADDVILGLAPLFHVTGLIGHVTLAMLTGSPLVLFYRFDVDEACRLAQLHRATFTVSAVTAFIALLNSEAMAKYDLSSLTKVYTGGAPTPPGVLADWYEKTGTRIHPMYGLTEATSPTHMTPHNSMPPVDSRTGAMSVGVPVFDTDVRIVTDAGYDAAPYEIGELVIAGPQIIPGYWQKPKETAAALAGGELRTGDVGFMDDSGWFYLVDRAKDMIVASGFKVWPREVEEVLYLHPAVREAAVIGISDPYRGETIKAVISLKPGHSVTAGEIKTFARERMAAYKYPRVVEIVEDLPKTTSGKIMRRLLQATTLDAGSPLRGAELELVSVSYPQLRNAVESRAVLEVGAIWLRLSRGPISRSTSETLYERLQSMLGQLDEVGRFLDRDAFLAASEAYHAAVIDLAENEHLSRAFRRLRLRELLASVLKGTPATPDRIVPLHEYLTDSIVATNAAGAVKAILTWGEASRATIRVVLGADESSEEALRPGSVVDDLSVAQAKEQSNREADVDALMLALDARAALEIGITQTLGAALTGESEREALVARLRAFTPLVRGTSPAHVARYVRGDDAFHRIFLSLLRNPVLFDIYNGMDVPELMRRVLEGAPPTIREVFDDHKDLTDALRSGDADATAGAITDHVNRVRSALAAFITSRPELAAGKNGPVSAYPTQ